MFGGLELFSPSPSTPPRPTTRKKRKLIVEVVIPVSHKRSGVHNDSLENRHASSRRIRPRDPKTGRLLPTRGRVVDNSNGFMPWIAHASDGEYDPGEITTTSTGSTPPCKTPKKAMSKGHKHTSSSSRGAGNTGSQGKKRRRSQSPASPASSISLGSTWYEPPKPKRAPRKRVKAGETNENEKGKRKATEENEEKSVGVVRFRSTPIRSPSVDVPQNFDSDAGYYSREFENKSRALHEERMTEIAAIHADLSSPHRKDRSPAYSGGLESDEVIQVEQELWGDEMQVELEERLDEPKDEPGLMDYKLHESPPAERLASHVSESLPIPSESFSSVARSLARHPSSVHNTPSAAGPSTAPGTNEWLRARGVDLEDRSSHEKQAFAEDRLENEEHTGLASDHNPPIKAPPIPTTPRHVINPQRSRLPHSTPTVQSVRRLDQSDQDFPPSSIRSNRAIGFTTPRRHAEAEFIQQTVYRTPIRASGHGSQRSHLNPHADAPATPLPQVNFEDPDIEYLSAVGLNIELDRLSAHYGLNREIVERVYQMKGGLSATTSTLEEMVSAMEGVLARGNT